MQRQPLKILRRHSIRTQLLLGFGIILALNLISAITGVLTVRNFPGSHDLTLQST